MSEMNTPYRRIREAAMETGLSQYYIRTGLKAGTIPHIKSGNRYLVNVPALIEILNRKSVEGMKGDA